MRQPQTSPFPSEEPLAPREDAAPADAVLVARAKHDRQAFAPLYRRYVGPVYRYCLVRLRDVEAAEDATSAVFTKALGSLSSCQDDTFRPWLFRIAQNVITDGFRSARPTWPLDAADTIPEPAASPEEIALVAESTERVVTLLASLPADQRRVLELRLAGLTGREIASVLGRSHGSVRMIQVRAAARLRDLYQAQVEARAGEADDDRT